jgi:DNA ligase-1
MNTTTETSFSTLALLSEQLEQTSSRLKLERLLAEFLRALQPAEVAPGARLVIGRVFPEGDGRALNVSWAALWKVVRGLVGLGEESIFAQAVDAGAAIKLLFEQAQFTPQGPPLTILDAYRTFEQIAAVSGSGSQQCKQDLLRGLLTRASAVEAKYLAKNVLGEMRHGVSEGLLLEAIAQAAGVPRASVERASMVLGDVGEVAAIALSQGAVGLAQAGIRLGRPLKPMLAQSAANVAEAFAYHSGQIALEYKLDGARVQIHKQGDEVRIFSRQLSDVTASLPDVAEQARRALRAQATIVEGEAIAVDVAGRPLPFQNMMRRFRRLHDVPAMIAEVPVQLYLFDLLYRDGESFLDRPYAERWQALEATAGGLRLTRRVVPQTAAEGEVFLQEALDAGHEGVMAKAIGSPYTPGVRGKLWFKIKPAETLDLVIVAADWGYGRRHGWLSNYHLAARDEPSGEYLEVGKTFKGLTDEEFQAITRRLLDLKVAESRGTVWVEPRIVAEVLYEGIQKSPHYKSGMALRFARIARFRDDKSPQEADTIQTMRELFARHMSGGAEGQGPDTSSRCNVSGPSSSAQPEGKETP